MYTVNHRTADYVAQVNHSLKFHLVAGLQLIVWIELTLNSVTPHTEARMLLTLHCFSKVIQMKVETHTRIMIIEK